MKYHSIAASLLLALAFVAIPVSAFTSGDLDIDVDSSGGAEITFSYQLEMAEKVLFVLTPNKEEFVKKTIAGKFPAATVTSVVLSDERAELAVANFATVRDTAGTAPASGSSWAFVWNYNIAPRSKTYTTPALSFTIGEDILEKYPKIASVVRPDFSPTVTTVRFPDGAEYAFYEVTTLPRISHTVTA